MLLLGLTSGVSLIFVQSEAFFVVPLLTIVGGPLGIFWEKSDNQVVPLLRTLSLVCFSAGLISIIVGFLYYLFRFSVYPEAIPAIADVITVVCAVLLYTQPRQHRLWGFLMVVMSVLTLFNPIWLWTVSLLPFFVGLIILAWDPAPKVSTSLQARYHTIAHMRHSFQPIPVVAFLVLLLLIPAIAAYPAVLPLEKTWSQTFILNAGENRLIHGSVSAEDIQVSGAVKVQNCCNSLYFDVRGYWDLDEVGVGTVVNDSYNFNVTAHQVVAYGLYSQLSPSSGAKQSVQLTVAETALTGSGSMLQTFLILYFSGLVVASAFVALNFAVNYLGPHRDRKTSLAQESQ